MPATTKTPLGASTLVRKWYLDVSTDGGTTWIGVFGITEFTPGVEGSMQDDSDFDGEGWLSEINSANRWKNEGKVRRGTLASEPTSYDPGQEALRLAGAKTGVANVIDCRWYEMEPGGPRVEAYQGKAAVAWTPDGGNTEALDTVSFTLSGRGKRETIAHPDDAA